MLRHDKRLCIDPPSLPYDLLETQRPLSHRHYRDDPNFSDKKLDFVDEESRRKRRGLPRGRVWADREVVTSRDHHRRVLCQSGKISLERKGSEGVGGKNQSG